MALTRPRYSQIPDSDYKNSCRVVTTTNIALGGGSPQTYDGVTLIQYDRVLVTGQTDATQNGIYSVLTLGSGSNGTWVRSNDANANDRLTAGMNTFIEEGTYTGQFWHLLTPGPIVLGVTELVFGQITGNAAGTSSQVQYNLSGSIAGAANLRYDSATGNVLIGGGAVSTSNVTGALLVDGGIGVTGNIWAAGNIYSDGSRILTVQDLDNVTFGYISGVIVAGNNIITSGNFVSNSGNVSNSTTTGALVITGSGGAGIGGNVNVGGNVTADKFYTTNGLFWAANGLAFSSGLEVSEIDTANVLSNISTQVTSIRFDKDTGFSVTELDPGNIKVSLGSSFKTWHVPGQADLVAVAEDEVTFFGNGIDITTNPTYPKSITFISNNSILEANIGAFYNYANANIGSIYNNVNTLDANLGSFQTYSNLAITSIVNNANANIAAYLNTTTSSNIAAANIITGNIFANSITLAGNINISGNIFTTNVYTGNITTTGNVSVDGSLLVQNIDILSNIGSFYSYANANIGTLFLGNVSTQANLGAYQTWANGQISGVTSELGSLSSFTTSNAAVQANSIAAIAANLSAFELYANTKIGTNNNSNLVIQSTQESVSATTGALVVAGGAGIAGNLYVAGNIFASNLVSIGTTTLTVQDPLLYLSASDPYPYNYDIGFFSHYARTSGYEQHTGLARNYTNNVWGFFSNLSASPGATVDWSNVEIIYDTVQVGDLIASNTTAATSTTTGALQVAGGAGIAGELYIANTGDVSANIGTIRTVAYTLDANVGAYQTYANSHISQIESDLDTYLGITTTFTVTDSGSSQYVINLENNPVLYLIRGQQYNFLVNAPGNNFYIKTYPSLGTGDQYSTGVTNNGTSSGIVVIDVALTAPDVLYYVSQFDATMTNEIRIVNFSTLSSNIGTLYLGNISTQANIGAFQTQTDANVGTLSLENISTQANLGLLYLSNISTQANIGTLYSGNVSTQANIGQASVNFAEFVAYANTKIGTNNNGNLVIDATTTSTGATSGALVVKGGVGVAGNVYSDKVYTTTGVYWAGNGAAYSSGSSGITYTASGTAPGSPTVGDQWFDTGDGILYEYIDDGDSEQWVDISSATLIASTSNNAIFNANITVLGNIYTTDGIFWASNSNPYSSGGGSGVDDTLRANVGAYQLYANANIGAYQLYANANIGTLSLGNVSTQANLGAFQTYANANIGTLFLGNASTQANLGAFQTYANTRFITYSNTNVTAYLTQGANIGSGSTTANLVAAATTTSSSTTTGALVVAGGMGVAGAAYIGGAARVTVGTASTNTTTGALVITGGTGISGALNVGSGGSFAGLLQTTATTAATSSAGGALYVAGGAGVVGNLYVDGNVVVGSGTSSNLVVKATTTSTSTTTGALVVRGGAGVAGNVYTDKVYTTSGIYWAGNGAVYSPTVSTFSSNVVASSGTASESRTTGALVVVGGAGVSGDLNVGAGSTVNGWTVGGLLQTTASTAATSASTGALQVINGGGVGVSGNLYVGNEFVVPGGGKITSSGLAYLLEKVTVTSGAPSGNVNIDLSTQSVMYWTGNATGNVSANIRGTATQPLNSLLAVGQSVTAVMFLPNGPSNYLVANVYIDNTAVTPSYQGNAAPALGNSNSMDIYSFTILKTASATYKVFASQTQFMHPG